MSVRVGVVGHVEVVGFATIDDYPRPGDIVHAKEYFVEAAGGGGVAAVQMRKLAGAATFFTALGEDECGRTWAREQLEGHGLDLRAAVHARPQRRGFCHLDNKGERTITVIGERLVPRGDDDLPWDELHTFDGIYFTGGDAAALRAARRARVLVATPRAIGTIREAGVKLDVLVASGRDPGERVEPKSIRPRPDRVVLTLGGEGGRWTGADGSSGGWSAMELPGPPVDAFGCGDSFAAGLTYGLGAGMSIDEALEMGARCGAWCLTGRGPYGNQLTLVDG